MPKLYIRDMENQFEKKSLVASWNGNHFPFEVHPMEDQGKIVFQVDLNDKDQKTIQHSYANGWWQLTGNQIYTDLLHVIGARIEQHYPDLF